MPLQPLIAEQLDALSPPPLFVVVFWLSMHVCYETGVPNHTWLVRFSSKYSAGQPHCNRQRHAVQCTETWAVSSAPHNSNAASTPWMWVAFFSRKVTTQSIIAVYCNIAWSLSIRGTGPLSCFFHQATSLPTGTSATCPARRPDHQNDKREARESTPGVLTQMSM